MCKLGPFDPILPVVYTASRYSNLLEEQNEQRNHGRRDDCLPGIKTTSSYLRSTSSCFQFLGHGRKPGITCSVRFPQFRTRMAIRTFIRWILRT